MTSAARARARIHQRGRGPWDSWDDDAFVRDKDSGIYSDLSRRTSAQSTRAALLGEGPSTFRAPRKAIRSRSRPRVPEEGRGFAAELVERRSPAISRSSPRRAYYRTGRRGRRAGPPAQRRQDDAGSHSGDRTDGRGGRPRSSTSSTSLDLDVVVARDFLSMLLRTDMSKFPLDEPVPDLEPLQPRPVPSASTTGQTLAKKESDGAAAALRAAKGRVNVISGLYTTLLTTWRSGSKGAWRRVQIMPPYIPGAFDDSVYAGRSRLVVRGLFLVPRV